MPDELPKDYEDLQREKRARVMQEAGEKRKKEIDDLFNSIPDSMKIAGVAGQKPRIVARGELG